MANNNKRIVATCVFLLRERYTSSGSLVSPKVRHVEILCGVRSPLNSEGKPRRFGGKLIPPGGKQEPGETLKQCACRETFEETGTWIDVDATEYLGLASYHYPQNRRMTDWQVHLYRALRWTGQPKAMEGFDTLGWYNIERLPHHLMMADMPIIVPALKLDQPVNGQLFRAEISYTDATCSKIAKQRIWFEDRPPTD